MHPFVEEIAENKRKLYLNIIFCPSDVQNKIFT
jgi:hypothetical protein